MTQTDVPSAAARLAELVAAVTAGETVVIADSQGRPVVRLVAVDAGTPLAFPETVARPTEGDDDPLTSARARGYGLYAGRIEMSDDCFDPLTDEELGEWGLL